MQYSFILVFEYLSVYSNITDIWFLQQDYIYIKTKKLNSQADCSTLNTDYINSARYLSHTVSRKKTTVVDVHVLFYTLRVVMACS